MKNEWYKVNSGDWRTDRAAEKRDKTITLRASQNDLNLLDGLIKKLMTARIVSRYSKYSRMDLIVDALAAYDQLKFPDEVLQESEK